MCTANALALDELATTLTGFATDDDLTGDTWVTAVAGAFIATPLDLPLDHTLYEALLTLGAFDLDEPETVELAANLTAYLLGTGYLTLCCDHTEPTALCEALANPDPDQLAKGVHDADGDTLTVLVNHRNAQLAWFNLQAGHAAAA